MSAQRGFGLVEMMVAITIGLFLILGLGTIFYSMRQTSIARQGLSDLQNNERMAMTFLGAGIQGAGFYPISNPFTTTAVTAFPLVSGSFLAGQSIAGTGTGGGYGVSSPVGTDTLSVRFVTPPSSAPGAVIQGCATGLTSNTLYTDVFSVQMVNGTSTLVCTESGTAIPLIAGVQGMSVRYGVDPTSSGSVTSYVSATGVTNWAFVKTVSVTLQFTNPLAGQPGQSATVNFTRTIPYMNGL